MDLKKNLAFILALSRCYFIGPQRIKRLLKYFGSPKFIWEADRWELQKAGLSEKTAKKFIQERKKINPEKEREKIFQQKIKIITIWEKNYPQILKKIPDPPFLLFYKGDLKHLTPSLAIVGSRKASSDGQQSTQLFSFNLARSGLTIISGLAFGIDTIAHQSALEAKGKTIAILGSGIDQKSFYPSANYVLSQKIINSGGAVISEYPPGTRARTFHFPLRNRIISGLSLGTLVIESPLKGGSLITANYALKHKRLLFTIPGNINAFNYKGNNYLLKKKQARLVTDFQDILKELKIKNNPPADKTPSITFTNSLEKILWKHLKNGPCHINQLTRYSKIPLAQVSSLLSVMELKGLIKNLGNMTYTALDKK